ncbi:PEP-CTERM sorting domain-containing protein [Pontiella sulfatireligans]|nr:PEP-CTERM sorting domain-containing protein [Pontiella sulfatireligans]
MKKLLTMVVLFAAGGVFAAPVEYFGFNEASGISIGASTNTGTIGSVWNFGGPGTVAQDGGGNLVIDTTHAGAMYRKLPGKGTANANATLDQYATPITTGAYRLEIDITSWDLTANAVGADMTWFASSQSSGGVNLAGIRLEKDSATTARIRLFTDLTGTAGGFRNYAYSLTEAGGANVAIEFDFDNNTVEYFIDGDSKQTFSDFEATQLGTLVFNTDAAWIAGSTVSINEMGLDVIPEPATLGLIVAFGGGILFIRRRFMI